MSFIGWGRRERPVRALQALFRIPFLKLCAVAGALACAGGAFVVGHGGAAAPATAPTVLDHYLCTGSLDHGGCGPASVSLPDGTTFGVTNPGDELVCSFEHRVGRHGGPPTTVSVTNELSPGGTTPVPLVVGREHSMCALIATPVSGAGHAHAHAHADVITPIETFDCTSTHSPSRDAARFTPPVPVTVNGNVLLRVHDPALLCRPDPQSAPSGGQDLVCFDARVVTGARGRFGPWREWRSAVLCVPSSEGGGSAPTTTAASTTTNPGTTTTTSMPATTTSRPTTTTGPAPVTTTAPTTTAPPTTAPPTTAPPTTAPPTTGAPSTTTSGTQPCAGVLINGVCFVNV